MMTPDVPPIDQGNQLLAETPALFITAVVDTAQGQRLALTIRTPSTTVTVLLNGPDAKVWAAQLTRDAASVSAAGLVITGTVMPNGNGVPK